MADTKMSLVDWLDDLCVRFIINLPQEELESVERICFQVEEAQWFYEDFVRPLDPTLPSLSLRHFCLLIFQHCPLLSSFSQDHHMAAFAEFLAYKTRVPVRGAIMLNQDMDQCVLVKGWKKGANWSFPRGKINKDEKDLDCAVREVYEETGFDIAQAGLVPDDDNVKFIQVTMREQHMKLFVFRGVPMNTPFQPRTRKEISKIQWYKLSTLPGFTKKKNTKNGDEDGILSANKLYMVAPFLQPLKKWIAQQHRISAPHLLNTDYDTAAIDDLVTDGDFELDDPRSSFMEPDFLQPQPETSQLASTSHQSYSPVNSATELKRLLRVSDSVRENTQTLVPAPPSNTMDLLSILQGSKSPPTAHSYHSEAPAPMMPRHNYNVPNPPYFHSQPQLQQQLASQMHVDYQHDFYSPPSQFNNATSNMRQPMFHGPPVQARFDPSRPQGPAPYQQTGDPQFTHQTSMPHLSGPSVPSASNLPPPKLNNHAMGLLSMFKNTSLQSSPSKTSHPVLQKQTLPYHTEQKPQAPPRQESNQSFGGLVPSIISPVSVSNTTPIRSPASQSNSHQNNLLNLFKPVPSNAPQMVQTPPTVKPETNQNNLLNLFKPDASTGSRPAQSQSANKPQQQENSLLNLLRPASSDKPTSPRVSLAVDSKVSENSLLSLLKSAPPDRIQLISAPAPLQPEVSKIAELSAVKTPVIKPIIPQASVPELKPVMTPVNYASAVSGRPPSKTIVPKSKPSTPKMRTDASVLPPFATAPKILKRPETASSSKSPEQSFAEIFAPSTESGNVRVDFKTQAHRNGNTFRQNSQASIGQTKASSVLRGVERGRSQKSAESSEEKKKQIANQPPIQILKRPQQLDSSASSRPTSKKRPVTPSAQTPNKRSQTPSLPAELNGSTPKIFQPTILRRPDQSPQAASPTTSQIKSENSSALKEGHKHDLLSLFRPMDPLATSKSKAIASTAPALEPIPTTTNIQEILAKTQPRDSSGANVGSVRPSISDATSRSASQRRKSGTNTPISPLDKGFFQNYLEGVLKGAAR